MPERNCLTRFTLAKFVCIPHGKALERSAGSLYITFSLTEPTRHRASLWRNCPGALSSDTDRQWIEIKYRRTTIYHAVFENSSNCNVSLNFIDGPFLIFK